MVLFRQLQGFSHLVRLIVQNDQSVRLLKVHIDDSLHKYLLAGAIPGIDLRGIHPQNERLLFKQFPLPRCGAHPPAALTLKEMKDVAHADTLRHLLCQSALCQQFLYCFPEAFFVVLYPKVEKLQQLMIRTSSGRPGKRLFFL